MSNIKLILCPDWLTAGARWAHLAHSGLFVLIPRKKKESVKDCKDRNFWKILATESQKPTEDSQNKEDMKESYHYLTTNKVGFLIRFSKQGNLNSY